MSENKEGFGWDDPVDATEKPRVILPEGSARFDVISMKRSRGECGKYGTQNVALVNMMVVSDVDGTEAEIEEKIWLVQSLKWKLLQFFTAIGQRSHGDKGNFVPDWSKVVGSGGACMIKHREFEKRDKTKAITHNIDSFVVPESAPEGSGFAFP